MKTTSLLRAIILSGACVAALGVTPAGAQSIASKLELLGTPASLEFTGLRMREQNGLLNIQAEVTNRDSARNAPSIASSGPMKAAFRCGKTNRGNRCCCMATKS